MLKVYVVTTFDKNGDLVNIDVFEDNNKAHLSCMKINIEGDWETIADVYEREIIKKEIR